jgi:hypothetical protein
MEFDTEVAEPSELGAAFEARIAVVGDDARALADERLGGRLPRAGETDDEDAPAAEPGIGVHCWN